jgi:hypothetical protein
LLLLLLLLLLRRRQRSLHEAPLRLQGLDRVAALRRREDARHENWRAEVPSSAGDTS